MCKFNSKNIILISGIVVTILTIFIMFQLPASANSSSIDIPSLTCGTYSYQDTCRLGGWFNCLPDMGCPPPDFTRCVAHVYWLNHYVNPTSQKLGGYISDYSFCRQYGPQLCSSNCN
jgi:hypothetical protein